MELLERATQLQALRFALGQVKTREGQGCIALVHGEAGIGKTLLVEHFVKENENSWRVLHGICDSLFTPRPLGPLHDIALQAQGQLFCWSRYKLAQLSPQRRQILKETHRSFP